VTQTKQPPINPYPAPNNHDPLDRSAAQSGLCREASGRPIAQTIDNSLSGSFLHWQCAPSGRTEWLSVVSRVRDHFAYLAYSTTSDRRSDSYGVYDNLHSRSLKPIGLRSNSRSGDGFPQVRDRAWKAAHLNDAASGVIALGKHASGLVHIAEQPLFRIR
jgi:hypothetical protein